MNSFLYKNISWSGLSFYLFLLGLVFLPTIVGAQGLVPECTYSAADAADQCGFNHALDLIKNVFDFIFALVIPAAALLSMAAGFMILLSGDNPSMRKKAKGMAFGFLKGLIIVMTAWLIVATILNLLGVDDAYSFLGS